jgi:intraflagellar transport protein 80
MVTATPQLVQYIYDYVSTGRWDACVRVCRFVKEESLWACVAAMAINARQLDTAKEALAAINEVSCIQSYRGVI